MLPKSRDPFELLAEMERIYAAIQDYTSLFRRRERVEGKWKPEETIFLKFQKPFKFYLRWLDGPHRGREAVYVEGDNDNKVSIHEPRGLARFVTAVLAPDGDRVLKESRFPLSDIGIGRIIELIGKGCREEQNGEALSLVEREREIAQGRECQRLEAYAPPGAKDTYPLSRILLDVDEELGLPTQVVLYDWDNVVVGEYHYSDVRLNPGLQKADFDTSNSSYNFPHWVISH